MKRRYAALGIVELATRVFYIVGAIAIGFLFVFMFADVMGRFLFNSPLIGATEITGYLLVAIGFLGLGYAQLRGSHIVVESVRQYFPKRARTLLNIVMLLLVIAFFVIMALQIGTRGYGDWEKKVLLAGTTVNLPVWWKSLIATIGCVLLIISLITQVIQNIISFSLADRQKNTGAN